MKNLFITRENLKVLIQSLKKACDEFIAPKKEHLEDIVFSDTKDSNDELLDYVGNSIISPRAFLLPQSEPLFRITSVKDSSFSKIEDKKKRIFYGLRPCDIKALVLMRRFFTDDFVDEFYKEKVDNSLFIGLACTERCSDNSFCYEMDSGPIAKKGFDLQLVALDDGYLVGVGSKKGISIVGKNRKLFKKVSPQHEKAVKSMLSNFAKGVKQIDYKRLAKIMQEDKVKESVWDDIGLRCVVCSGCITLCPTCSCFSVADRLSGNPECSDFLSDASGSRSYASQNSNIRDRGIRMRYCDGCPYAGFTRMAGGSIPQPQHKDHIRRFFEHKLNVDIERYGTPSCVGCARCINTCPGNISIRKFMEEVWK